MPLTKQERLFWLDWIAFQNDHSEELLKKADHMVAAQFARAFLLKMQTETVPTWRVAKAMLERYAAKHERIQAERDEVRGDGSDR